MFEFLKTFADWIVISVGLDLSTRLGTSVSFFIEDTIKIFLLIYVIIVVRVYPCGIFRRCNPVLLLFFNPDVHSFCCGGNSFRNDNGFFNFIAFNKRSCCRFASYYSRSRLDCSTRLHSCGRNNFRFRRVFMR